MPALTAADGAPLGKLPGLGSLAAQLTRVHVAQLRRGNVRTTIRPDLQRALVSELRGLHGAGVVVDVRTGRLLAAAGTGGRSPWTSVQPPGATLDAVLAAGALDASAVSTSTRLDGDDGPGDAANDGGKRFGPITVEQALARTSRTAFADIAVRLDGATVDNLLERVGFGSPARATDLKGLVTISRGPGLTPTGVHGVGSAPNFVDARGAYRDFGALTQSTTFELGQVALALASDGRRTDIGVTAPGPKPYPYTPWGTAAGAQVRGMLPRSAISGSQPDGDSTALSTIAFAPRRDPEVAVALTAVGRSGTEARAVLGPRARAILTQATDGH